VPDLASLVRQVGGDRVSVTAFAKGTEDPHFLDAKPSFVRALSQADVFVVVGLYLESGWTPALLQNCRNARVLPGGGGYVDVSAAIRPLEVVTGRVDRSMGDVHASGNPHYLLDPINGLKAARLIADKLIALRPDDRDFFEQRYAGFAGRLSSALVGEPLAKKYSAEEVQKLALLFERGKLAEYLKGQGEAGRLGGWLGAMQPYYGTKVVDDHNLWPYFARRFGITVAAHMEPKPGLPPTTAHLTSVVDLMRGQQIRVVLANAYYDARHGRFIAQQSGARIAQMAHQVGARPGTDDYLAMIDYNVQQFVAALRENP
jgi:ABC-type Zn uptake system ZnuABC Zn-binding protein ZnuA